MSSPCSQVDDSYHLVLWPVPWNPLCVRRAGSVVIVVCRCADVIERFDSSGDRRIHQSECLSLCFVCRLPGLVVPVGRGIELTIDRLALRDIGVRNW